MKNLFITIEGIDGTGKSTISKMLAAKILGTTMQTPQSKLQKEREVAHQSNCRLHLMRFYMKSIIEQQSEIENAIKNSHIVCDRYIHSTLAYQWPEDKKIPMNLKNSYPFIRWPDITFLLHTDNIERNNRILKRERENNIHNPLDHLSEEISLAEKRFFTMKELIRIDTTDKSPQHICNEMLIELEGIK